MALLRICVIHILDKHSHILYANIVAEMSKIPLYEANWAETMAWNMLMICLHENYLHVNLKQYYCQRERVTSHIDA